MIKPVAIAAAALVAAAPAAAQAVGNPAGNTLAPQTGSVASPSAPVGATGGDLAHAATPALAEQKQKTEIVCKTTIETGSLIARHKTCLTRKQWQYVNDENEREARRLVQDNTSRPGSN